VLLPGRRAALEVVAHPRDAPVSVLALEFELDVLIEAVEALLTGELVARGAE
jgi:hypothetical protein